MAAMKGESEMVTTIVTGPKKRFFGPPKGIALAKRSVVSQPRKSEREVPMRARFRIPKPLGQEPSEKRFNGVISQLPHLVISSILDWMGDKHRSRGNPKRRALGRGSFHECAGGNEDPGQTTAF